MIVSKEGKSIMKRYMNILITALVMSCGAAMADSNYNYTQNMTAPAHQPTYYAQPKMSPNQPLRGSVVTVPAGQAMPAVVTMPLNSANLTLGQNVTVALGSDFYYNNNLIAPAGSSVTGTVLEVSKAKRGSMNGKLMLRFTQIVTPYGIQIPISAVIRTDDNTGRLVGGTKADVAKDYAKDLTVGAGAGAVSGVVFGALAGGDIGKGAALGTAVGAGGGLIKSVWDKGDDVVIPANSNIELVLTQPITVNPAIYNSNY